MNTEELPPRDPPANVYLDHLLYSLWEDQPIIGEEMLLMMHVLLARSRTVWTGNELRNLVNLLMDKVEEQIESGGIRFRDEDGEYPLPTAEERYDPEKAAMFDALINGIPEVPAEWMEES